METPTLPESAGVCGQSSDSADILRTCRVNLHCEMTPPRVKIESGNIVVSDCIGNVAHAERIAACVNACSGMADPAAKIQAMREAIKDAHFALDYVYNHGEGSCSFPFRVENDLCAENRFHHVQDALDALKPFIEP